MSPVTRTDTATPLEDQLSELVGQLAGGFDCVWKDEPAGSLGSRGGARAWLILTDTNDRQVGSYEYRQWANPENPLALKSRVYGYGLRTITIEAHSFEWIVKPRTMLDRVRWGLRTFTAKAVYRRTKTAFVRTGPITVSRSYAKDGTTRLDAFVDWTFAYVSGDEPNDDGGQTIGQVNSGGVIPVTVLGE